MAVPKPSKSIRIKDGEGNIKQLAAETASENPLWDITYHCIYGDVQVTSSEGQPIYAISHINNFPNIQKVETVEGNSLSIEVQNWPSTYTVVNTEENRLNVTGVVQINNFPSVQTITSSNGNAIFVSGAVNVNNFPSIQTVTSSIDYPVYEQKSFGSTVSETFKNTFSWNTNASGTFQLAAKNNSRRELMIYNSGPGILYIKLSSADQTDGTKHGFTLNNTSSVPTLYNFVVYPSGTYVTSDASRVLYHGGYFVSSSLTGTVVATSIT